MHPDGPGHRFRIAVPLGVATIATVGLVIRLASFRSSLWLDEFSTLWAVESSLVEMLRRVPQVMGQSPLFFSLPWLSIHTFGESAAALRLPSLIAVFAASLVVARAASTLGGMRAAVWAALLFWMSYPAIWASVDARPYGLALLFGAVAVAGFADACLTGRRKGRAMWIIGVSGLVWTHFVFAPFLGGLAATYVARRPLRRVYSPQKAATDLAIATALILPSLPQLTSLLQRPEIQHWMFRSGPLAVLSLVGPFALAALFPTGRPRSDETCRELRTALFVSIVVQMGALVIGTTVGIDLLESRYAVVVVVAAAVLSGDTLARLTLVESLAPVVVYVMATGLTIAGTRQVLGSLSGAGFQQWRGGVAAIRSELAVTPLAPVLYRSGNSEDDLGPAGQLNWPATLAPLRSPGEQAPEWNIVPLTYRWHSVARERYFDTGLSQRIETAPVVLMLCLSSSEPDSNGYCGNVVSWIRARWPGRFHTRSLGTFRSLTVLRFDRTR